jgi:hypothetical protein
MVSNTTRTGIFVKTVMMCQALSFARSAKPRVSAQSVIKASDLA